MGDTTTNRAYRKPQSTDGAVNLTDYWRNLADDVDGDMNVVANPAICKVRQTVAQSLTNSTATPITFTTEDVDTSGMHSTSSNTSRIVATVAGWYMCNGNISYASNATGIRTTAWQVNGTPINGAGTSTTPVTGVSTRCGAVGTLLFLNVGDYVELLAFQSSGGALLTAVSGSEQSTISVAFVHA